MIRDRFTPHNVSHGLLVVACATVTLLLFTTADAQAPRPRARDLGIEPGVFPPGPLNAITDVGGVRVGHTTIIDGDRVRTGVTAVLPHPGNLFQEKVPGAVFVGNAFGKLAGSTQVDELGTIETPDPAHQHAERGHRGGRRCRLDARAARQRATSARSTRWSARRTTAA